jgi:adenosylcobinamide-GDP ribazoletransferase
VDFFSDYLSAIRAHTRVPVTGALGEWAGPREATDAARAHLPGVGWLVGATGCVAFAVIGLVLPDNPFGGLVAAVASVTATSVLTGATHDSALARLAQQRAFPGSLAMLLTVLAKVSLLAFLAARSPAAVLAGVLCAHVSSRAALLVFARERDPRAIAIAGAWWLPAFLLALVGGGAGFAVVGSVLAALAALAARYWLRADTPGEAVRAAQPLCEIAFYLGAAIGIGAR